MKHKKHLPSDTDLWKFWLQAVNLRVSPSCVITPSTGLGNTGLQLNSWNTSPKFAQNLSFSVSTFANKISQTSSAMSCCESGVKTCSLCTRNTRADNLHKSPVLNFRGTLPWTFEIWSLKFTRHPQPHSPQCWSILTRTRSYPCCEQPHASNPWRCAASGTSSWGTSGIYNIHKVRLIPVMVGMTTTDTNEHSI